MAKNIPVLSISRLVKRFDGTAAINGINLTVHSGEVLGIVGPNGAGKTTTIKAILGLLDIDSGSIELFGEKDLQKPNIRRRLGYMPESPRFFQHLTGRELITLAGELHGLDKKTLQARVHELLETVSLSKAADRQIGTYSKGMLQRVCLAQALVNEPELLLLDEPLDGLDPLGRIEMRSILEKIKASGTAIVVNSHILSDVETTCSHVAIMHMGEIMLSGTVKEVVPKGKTLEEIFLANVS